MKSALTRLDTRFLPTVTAPARIFGQLLTGTPAGLVEHHAEQSQLVLPRLCGEGQRFDLAFVDGNHRFDAVFVDLFYLGRLVRPGGIILLDDYHLPGIARAASFFLANLGWNLEESSTAEDRHHWAVLRTSTTPDTRPFDYFTDF